MPRIALKLLVLAVLLPLPAAALLTRADRDDDEYAELATRYPSAISLGVGQGEGVLVAPRWVLTAAHRAVVLQDLKPRPTLAIGARRYEIEAVVLHPGWKGGRDDDIALLRLATPVADVAPAALQRVPDEDAKGIVLVAHGSGGRLGASTVAPRRRRASINTVGGVGPKSFSVTIKAGDDASDLQGAAVREETGAPAYLDSPEGFTVAGILAAIGEAPDAPAGSAGEKEFFTRVSAYAAWIDANIR
ncbi:MAG TPA: trypsin-like serine protease [Usitatibacter sp.]|jgi:hypothetical protein|nr:trypsin-like serine protease [Usitatibacter sp.]